MRKTLLALSFLTAAFFATGQQFNYVQYDTKDGLAGSTVYDMCQDKDGFMWFATDNGLSRYDGSRFKNFTVNEGLPDNEVLTLFSDSKGRTWISTFNKELCYYYKGEIYTRRNDSLLAKMQVDNFTMAVAEDKAGVLAFSDESKVIIIVEPGSQNRVFRYKFKHSIFVTSHIFKNGRSIVFGDEAGNVYLYENRLFKKINSDVRPQEIQMLKKGHFISYTGYDGKASRYISQKPNYIRNMHYNNYLLFCSTFDGVWVVDTATNTWGAHYLAGKKVTNTIIDTEKNTWFSTMGEGVYKLSSREIRTIAFTNTKGLNNSEVYSVVKSGHQIIAGLNHGTAAYITGGSYFIKDYSGAPSEKIMRPQTNRLFASEELSDKSMLLGYDMFLLREKDGKRTYNYIYPVKSVEEINRDSVIAGTSSYVFILSLPALQIVDTIWRGRCTKVFYHENKYFIGTINGLYQVNKNKTRSFLGNLHAALTRRITDIKAATDGTLWIATADAGLVAFKDNHIAAVIKDTNGLSSNICRTLFLNGRYLWAGTNKGLNKIDISNKTYPIIKYSVSDGLPSNLINAVYATDSLVYVGTPAGLTFFNESRLSSYSVCMLQMMAITVSGQKFNAYDALLSYKQNNISFSYAGVSLKSAGDMLYHYRLKGLSDEWFQTGLATVNYASLAPGDYVFELYAVNKFGVKSETISVNFSVAAPFWKTLWFYILLVLFAAGITGWLVNARNKKYQKKLVEANALQKQFAGLEQQALQAQMNPHFIFNCLNGIQQYILTGNKEKANEFLTGFARLIRQTLDNSGKKSISIAQEIKYLTEYLEMEKMRSGDSFRYIITADNNTDKENTEIPAMLLQPYIENALRHGLRYKTQGTGEVQISFVKKGDTLVCTIKDNGVGRVWAADLKSRQHIEYQSKGMSLTARRIDLLNKINDIKITIDVNDLYDYNNAPAGTEVVIQIPVN